MDPNKIAISLNLVQFILVLAFVFMAGIMTANIRMRIRADNVKSRKKTNHKKASQTGGQGTGKKSHKAGLEA